MRLLLLEMFQPCLLENSAGNNGHAPHAACLRWRGGVVTGVHAPFRLA